MPRRNRKTIAGRRRSERLQVRREQRMERGSSGRDGLVLGSFEGEEESPLEAPNVSAQPDRNSNSNTGGRETMPSFGSSSGAAQSPSPSAALSFSIQPHRNSAPMPVQLWLYPQRPSTSPLRIHVHSHQRVTYQTVAAVRSGGKRMRSEDARAPRKRARRGSQVPEGESAWGGEVVRDDADEGIEEVNEVEVEAQALDVGESDEDVQPSYIVNMGLIRAFPNWEDSTRPSTSPGQTETRPRTRPRVHVQMMQLGASKLIILIIIIILTLGCIAILIFTLPSSPSPPPTTPKPHIEIELAPLPLFTTALSLELSLMSLSRIILFGETAHQQPRWQSLPGLRPDLGHIHPDPVIFGPPAPEWFSNSSFFPRYKPWETTSTGVYLPEEYFLRDLRLVLRDVVHDLRDVADHAPLDFRFSSGGGSTQFRWSTSAGDFIPPHASLPTLTPPLRERLTPGSTILGITTNSSGAFPTARPARVHDIFNLDPPLTALAHGLSEALLAVNKLHASQMADWSALYPVITEERARRVLILLEDLEAAMVGGSSHEWGSDQGRVECLYREGRPSVVDLAGAVEVTKQRRATDAPVHVPVEFARRVANLEALRRERSMRYEASVRASATSTSSVVPTPPCIPSLHDWATNTTALTLLSILNKSAAYRYDGADLPDENLPKYYDLLPYASALQNLSTVLQDLNARVQQVRLLPSDLPDVSPFAQARLETAVSRLKDLAPFLDEIAVPRVSEMSLRATRGLTTLLETTALQSHLQSQIANLTSTWSTPPTYLHFPCIHSLVSNWTLAYAWFEREGASVRQTFHDRQAEFMGYREGEPAREDVVWSRWGVLDVRKEPEGRERLCWRRGVVEGGRWKGKWCGDATGRHGY